MSRSDSFGTACASVEVIVTQTYFDRPSAPPPARSLSQRPRGRSDRQDEHERSSAAERVQQPFAIIAGAACDDPGHAHQPCALPSSGRGWCGSKLVWLEARGQRRG
jgi:hypothetical protein